MRDNSETISAAGEHVIKVVAVACDIFKNMSFPFGSPDEVSYEDLTLFSTALELLAEDFEAFNTRIRAYKMKMSVEEYSQINEEAIRSIDKIYGRNDGAKGEESVTCDTCKHSRWFGEYGTHVCEKRGKVCHGAACNDYEQKGNEK